MRVVSWIGIAAVAVTELMGGEFSPSNSDWSEEEEEVFETASSWSFRERVDTEASVLWADGVTLSEYTLGGRLTSDPLDRRSGGWFPSCGPVP